MARKFMEIATTPSVMAAQKHYFGRAGGVSPVAENDVLGVEEKEFIAQRDSFYMATVNENGWPYIQHRGGKAGFIHLIEPNVIAFADYRGNRQMLTTGNLAVTDRVSLFLMDYPNRARLKIMGHARVDDAREHPKWVEKLAEPEVRYLVERIFRIEVVAYDWNCQQYISPRFTETEIREMVSPLHLRIAELETALARAKS